MANGKGRFWQNRDRITREYKLPSCGWLYGDAFPSGIVNMSAIRGEDEEVLAGSGEGRAALPVLREKLKQLAPINSEMEHEHLLFSDWYALLFNFFAFSYGGDFNLDIKCPHCKQFPHTPYVFGIDALPCRVLDECGLNRDEYREPFTTMELPPHNDVVSFRLLRLQDQLDAEKYLKQAESIGRSGDVIRTWTTARHIVAINGEEVNHFEAMDWVKFGTTGLTLLRLREEFAAIESGYTLVVRVACTNPGCSGSFNVHLPEDGSFFRTKNPSIGGSAGAEILDNQPESGG